MGAPKKNRRETKWRKRKTGDIEGKKKNTHKDNVV